MSDYSETLTATGGKNPGKLHEELSTWRGKAETFKGLADSFKRDADAAREELAQAYRDLAEARRKQAEAQHRARSLQYALQPFAEMQHLAGDMLPIDRYWIDEAFAIMAGTDAGPRVISRLVAQANENALRRNDGKPDWRGDSPYERLEKLTEEHGEVHEAVMVYLNEDVDTAHAMNRIAEECEDVIASAGFLLDWARGWNTINRGREVAV